MALKRLISPGLFMVLIFLLTFPEGALAQNSARVTGVVFEDLNGNGLQDNSEPGLSDVVVVGIEEDTGSPITTSTAADGSYTLESPVINHQVQVDESSLPFDGELTTSRLQYNLNVPPGFTAPNVSFGYQQVEPAAALGTVFQDTNGNGRQEDGEPGLDGVVLVFTHDETGALSTMITDEDGGYRFQSGGSINH